MKHTLLCLTVLLAVSAALAHDLRPLTAASNFLSQLLYQQIAVNETNVAFSPYSIHAILSMITLGATGATYEQLARTIGISQLPRDLVYNGYRGYSKELYCIPYQEIRFLNILLVPPTTPLEQKYIEELKVFFYTGVGRFDYSAIGGPERPINDFVDRKTEGFIPGLLPSGFITPDTSLLALSLFNFNATFREPFDPSRTTKRPFVNLCEAGGEVELMNDIRYANVRTNVLSSTVLELPFAVDQFSFYAVLPDQLEGIAALESSLTNPDNLNQLFTGSSRATVQISLPRFKVLSKFNLRQPLEQLGLTRAFSQREAELRGISQSSLHVTQIVHSIFFELNEYGAYEVPTQNLHPQPSVTQPGAQITFNADRPFLFFVRDNLSHQLLVQGKFSG